MSDCLFSVLGLSTLCHQFLVSRFAKKFPDQEIDLTNFLQCETANPRTPSGVGRFHC
jgi:hypothetical protein